MRNSPILPVISNLPTHHSSNSYSPLQLIPPPNIVVDTSSYPSINTTYFQSSPIHLPFYIYPNNPLPFFLIQPLAIEFNLSSTYEMLGKTPQQMKYFMCSCCGKVVNGNKCLLCQSTNKQLEEIEIQSINNKEQNEYFIFVTNDIKYLTIIYNILQQLPSNNKQQFCVIFYGKQFIDILGSPILSIPQTDIILPKYINCICTNKNDLLKIIVSYSNDNGSVILLEDVFNFLPNKSNVFILTNTTPLLSYSTIINKDICNDLNERCISLNVFGVNISTTNEINTNVNKEKMDTFNTLTEGIQDSVFVKFILQTHGIFQSFYTKEYFPFASNINSLPFISLNDTIQQCFDELQLNVIHYIKQTHFYNIQIKSICNEIKSKCIMNNGIIKEFNNNVVSIGQCTTTPIDIYFDYKQKNLKSFSFQLQISFETTTQNIQLILTIYQQTGLQYNINEQILFGQLVRRNITDYFHKESHTFSIGKYIQHEIHTLCYFLSNVHSLLPLFLCSLQTHYQFKQEYHWKQLKKKTNLSLMLFYHSLSSKFLCSSINCINTIYPICFDLISFLNQNQLAMCQRQRLTKSLLNLDKSYIVFINNKLYVYGSIQEDMLSELVNHKTKFKELSFFEIGTLCDIQPYLVEDDSEDHSSYDNYISFAKENQENK